MGSTLDQDMSSHACPLSPGEEMLHFSLSTFPKQVTAGAYDGEIKAVEENGAPLVCLLGKVIIPEASDGSIVRYLQEATMVSGAEKTGANLYMIFGFLVLMIARK